MNEIEVVVELFDKNILNRKGLAKALMVLKLDSREAQHKLGFPTFNEFVDFITDDDPVSSEFMSSEPLPIPAPPPISLPETPASETSGSWTIEEAILIHKLSLAGATASQIGVQVGRSKDSINGIIKRTFKQQVDVPAPLFYAVSDHMANLLIQLYPEAGERYQEFYSSAGLELLIDSVTSEVEAEYPQKVIQFASKIVLLQDYCNANDLPTPNLNLTV